MNSIGFNPILLFSGFLIVSGFNSSRHNESKDPSRQDGLYCCSTFCDGMFAETVTKSEDWFACHRGCRYATLIQLLKGGKSKDTIVASCHTACTESYNATRSLKSSCQLGCDKHDSLDIKTRRMKSDHRSMLPFYLTFPFSYKISWTNTIVEQDSSDKEDPFNPIVLLKHSWSNFFKNSPSLSLSSSEQEEKQKGQQGLEKDTAKKRVKKLPLNNTSDAKESSKLEQLKTSLDTGSKPKNKTLDCILRSSVWPPFYFQSSNNQFEGVDLVELCARSHRVGHYMTIVAFILVIIIIVLIFIQMMCPIYQFPKYTSDLDWREWKCDEDSGEESSQGIFSFECTDSLAEIGDKYPPSYEEALKMLPTWNGYQGNVRLHTEVV